MGKEKEKKWTFRKGKRRGKKERDVWEGKKKDRKNSLRNVCKDL